MGQQNLGTGFGQAPSDISLPLNTGPFVALQLDIDGNLKVTTSSGEPAAVTIAAGGVVAGALLDGADATQGTKEDAAYTGEGATATIVAILKSIAQKSPLPVGATQITAASGNQANANAVATLAAVAGKTTFITGFTLTASGVTTALPVIATIVGTISGTLSYIFVFPAGVLVAATTLNVIFDPPIPASAADTTIVVTLPAGGAGGTNAAAVATGFQV